MEEVKELVVDGFTQKDFETILELIDTSPITINEKDKLTIYSQLRQKITTLLDALSLSDGE